MNQHEILSKLSDLKGNIQHLLARVGKHDSSSDVDVDEDVYLGADNVADDLPLTINRDTGPSVTYYTTENSEFARGEPKEAARGIDTFGEESVFTPEEASDFQTYRDRNQTPDLSERF